MLNLGLIYLQKAQIVKNTQKKLFMDERSFQGLPPVLGSHCILFHVPAVVSEKIYIPLAEIECLGESTHHALHSNLQRSLESSLFDCRNSSLTDFRALGWEKLFSSCSFSF